MFRLFRVTTAMLAMVVPSASVCAQDQAAPGAFTLKVQSDIVLTNVVVRDRKTGEVVKGLKPSDFTVLENGKPQKVASFDYENVDQAAALKETKHSGGEGVGEFEGRRHVEQQLRVEIGGVARSPADCHVLRPEFDATGGH